MNRMIVDAGATKSDFLLLSDGEIVHRYSGTGLNPNYMSEKELLCVFDDFVQECTKACEVDEVLYYGAGCASAHNAAWMKDLIGRFFVHADIQVFSDLMAVCHALSRGQTSIVSILGTGSASCLFNGAEIVCRAPSLGYMLGDEGSGTHLGKQLLTCYLRDQLPEPLKLELERTYDLSFEKVICRLYREPEPNRWISKLAPFVQRHLEAPMIRQLAYEAFDAFFATQKSYYAQSLQLLWHLSGSVAYFFQDVVREAAIHQACPLGMIVASPMEKLMDYYKM